MRNDYANFLEKQRLRKEKSLKRIKNKTLVDFTKYLSPEVPDNLKAIAQLTHKYNLLNSDAKDVDLLYDKDGNIIKQPPIFLYPPTINNKLQLITTPDQVCYIERDNKYKLTDNFEVYNNLDNPNEIILVTKKDNIPIVSLPFIVYNNGYSQSLTDASFDQGILETWTRFNNEITQITKRDNICYKIKDNTYVLSDNFKVYNEKDNPNKIIIVTERPNILNVTDKKPTTFDCTKIVVDPDKDTNFNFTLINPKNTTVYFDNKKQVELNASGNHTYYMGIPKGKKVIVTFYGDFDGVHFLNCLSVIGAVQLKTTTVSCSNMFKNCYNMELIYPSFIISDNVTNMNNIFESCIKVRSFPSSFRIGKNVTSIQSAFSNMQGLEFFPKGFTIPDKVVNMSWAFDKMNSLKEFPVGFNIGKSVTQATCSFQYSSIERLPNGFCFQEGITQLYATFSDCKYLKELPNSFKIPDSVTSVYLLFNNCYSLEKLPKDFKFGKNITTATAMFQYNYKLRYLPETFVLNDKVVDVRFMFYDSGLVKLPKYFTITDSVTNMENMFTFAKLRELPENFKIGNSVTTCSQAFAVCEDLKYINKNFAFGNKVTVIKQLFQQSGIEKIPDNFTITDTVTDASLLFYLCKNLKEVPKNFKTGKNNINCYALFAESALQVISSGFEFEKSDNISYAFSGCPLTKVIDFKISSDVKNLEGLFEECINFDCSLNDLLPNVWNNTSINIARAFYNCKNINSEAPADKLWNSSNSFTSTDCFFNCLNISNYNEIPSEWGGKEQILRITSKSIELIGFDYEEAKIEDGIIVNIEKNEEVEI